MQSYYVPMRWDNYGSTANDSRGGISMWSDKRFRLFRLHAGVEDPEVSLTNSFDITEGAWHWLEVHQKFSTTDGLALNEVFVDDILVAQSTARNYYGYPITRLRNGIVALGNQTNALEMSMDRLTISSTRVGAGSNTVPPPVLNPVDTIAPTIPTNLRISAGLEERQSQLELCQ